MFWPVSNLVAFESPGPLVFGPLDPLVLPSFRNSGAVKQGNRLTRRPCKGDKFEIEIFEAKRQNAGICGTCQKIFATWTFISIGRQCDSSSKICISPAQWISFCSSGTKNNGEFMIFKFPMQTSTRFHPFFLSFRSISAKYGSGMQPPRARRKHVNNGNKFRGPCVRLVKNAITPPPPPCWP